MQIVLAHACLAASLFLSQIWTGGKRKISSREHQRVHLYLTWPDMLAASAFSPTNISFWYRYQIRTIFSRYMLNCPKIFVCIAIIRSIHDSEAHLMTMKHWP